MNRLRSFTLVSLSLLYLLAAFPALAENPRNIHPSGYVTDLAGVIAPDTKARLEALCREVEEKTGAQIAVVTVHSLEGESIENYAVDLYKQLGVGSKRDSRGVLLLVAPDEHKYRIEVGYGLEPVINDARAGDAGRAMVPMLRQGNYSAAIETATWVLAKYIADDRGVTLSGQPPARPRRKEGKSFPISFWGILFIIWIIFSIARAGRRAGRGGRGGGGGWWIGPMLGGMGGGWRGGGFGGSSGGYSGGGGFGGFGGGSSGGGGASGNW
ncbi:MAG TPA: TPM domain-containing protein [Candidatus Acidoferrum sp.]|nr:TPM domain-containing protein [Candidatus Acidoferrum sp.]